MPPIGDTLREARMRQQLDIVDVEERTKIRAKYLRALENEEWGLLPGPTFVRTFLRTYAEAVGLDPHVLVEEYRNQHDDNEETEPPQPRAATPRRRQSRPSRPERRRPPSSAGPPGPLAVLAGAVVLVLVGLLVLGILGDNEEPAGQSAGQTTTTQTQTAARRPAARRRPKPKPAPAGVTVKVEPTAPTYVCMDSGDGSDKVYEGILEQGRTFKNPRELRINLGKRAVKVTANGKPVTIAPSAEPLGLKVTRAGAAEISDGPRPCA